MRAQSINDQTFIEKIHTLPPEKVSKVLDFVEFLVQRQEQAQDEEDVAEAQRRMASADPAQRDTLDDLRQAWQQ